MNVLVINCGSSSLKYQLIDSETEAVLAKGLCERIGIDGRLVYQKTGLDKEITEAAMPTHKQAIQMVLDAIVNPKTGASKSLAEVDAVGHRVVHGGEKFARLFKAPVLGFTIASSTIWIACLCVGIAASVISLSRPVFW